MDDLTFAQKLREAIVVGAAAGTIGSSVTHEQLLELIVGTAMQVLHAQAAAVLLKDEESDELVFEVALGGEAAAVSKFRIPLGHGLAGFVALTGQPVAIADADSDPRTAKDIAESVGYMPKTILCVPLVLEDEVTGVLEVLDKEGDEPFSAADIHSLGLFANLAAVAIEHSRVQGSVRALVDNALRSLAGGEDEDLRSGGDALATWIESDPTAYKTLELARLVHELAAGNEQVLELCRTVLEGFARYVRSRSAIERGEQP